MYNPAYSVRSDEEVLNKVKNKYGPQVEDYNNRWDNINYEYGLTHFLLKNRYIDNWQREVCEDYFSIPAAFWIKQLPNYAVEYKSVFCVPFIRKQIKKDLGIDWLVNTHIKLILKRER